MSYNDFWVNKQTPSGFGGMSVREERKRTYETRTIDHTDGSRETVQTITEIDTRVDQVSAANSKDYKEGINAFVTSRAQTMPMHHLTNMRNDMMQEMLQRLGAGGSGDATPLLKKQG